MTVSIKVATYNIHKCIGLDRKRDPARILSVLTEIDADIVTLQEADMRFGTRESCLPAAMIAAQTSWEPVLFNIRPGGIGWHGNAILVRKGTQVRSSHPLDLPMLEPRGAVEAEVVIEGHHIRIIGAHLDLSGLWRRRQVRAMLAHIEAAPRYIPTIMMGDFNQWSDRGALSEFAFHHHRIIKTPKSFHSARPVAHLDRIIVSHDIMVEGQGAHISDLSQKASDHLPIWAQLRLGRIA
jgi:endonuclease/exonuclease/phosphatase family metal-dependent hydrolase